MSVEGSAALPLWLLYEEDIEGWKRAQPAHVAAWLGEHQFKAERHRVLLVPDRAVGFDQSKKFVYVVDADNKVSYREVELGQSVDKKRVVEGGLNAGDRVIVDGTQSVRPNDVVSAKEVADDASPTLSPQVANK